MIKIYTSLDIGNYEIKLLVFEIVNKKYHLLGQFTTKSKGIKKNKIVDFSMLSAVIKQLVLKAEKNLNCSINKVVVSIPNVNTNFKPISKLTETKIEAITGDDITNIMRETVNNQLSEDEELVSFIPIEFKVDSIVGVKRPLGMSCNSFGVKGMMMTQPKNQIHDIVGLLSSINIEVVDMVLSSVGDYYENRGTLSDSTLGAMVNIGFNKTDITMFNLGVPFVADSINMGSFNVDYDIAYINNLSLSGAKRLKEDFVLATTSSASIKEIITVKDNEKKEIVLNQLDLSKVVEARLEELLKMVKNKINTLTNLQVSYIIITGGITELVGFRKLCSDEFGSKVILGDIKTAGIRHNKFSTAAGAVKYFNEKMVLRQREYSMLNEEELERMVTIKNKKNLAQTNVLGKIFGNFMNKED